EGLERAAGVCTGLGHGPTGERLGQRGPGRVGFPPVTDPACCLAGRVDDRRSLVGGGGQRCLGQELGTPVAGGRLLVDRVAGPGRRYAGEGESGGGVLAAPAIVLDEQSARGEPRGRLRVRLVAM